MNSQTSFLEFLNAAAEECPELLTIELMDFLVRHGCDFYEVIRAMTREELTQCSQEEIRTLYRLAPKHRQLKSLDPGDIHGMIARWTATKYHTGPIQEVIRDIRLKCLNRQVGLSIYNSNLNPQNPKAANDPYILLVTEEGICFLDLNRKISYHYTY